MDYLNREAFENQGEPKEYQESVNSFHLCVVSVWTIIPIEEFEKNKKEATEDMETVYVDEESEMQNDNCSRKFFIF